MERRCGYLSIDIVDVTRKKEGRKREGKTDWT